MLKASNLKWAQGFYFRRIQYPPWQRLEAFGLPDRRSREERLGCTHGVSCLSVTLCNCLEMNKCTKWLHGHMLQVLHLQVLHGVQKGWLVVLYFVSNDRLGRGEGRAGGATPVSSPFTAIKMPLVRKVIQRAKRSQRGGGISWSWIVHKTRFPSSMKHLYIYIRERFSFLMQNSITWYSAAGYCKNHSSCISYLLTVSWSTWAFYNTRGWVYIDRSAWKGHSCCTQEPDHSNL